MPELALTLGRRSEVVGGWMPSLLNAIRTAAGIELAIATKDPEVNDLSKHVINGVTYFRLPASKQYDTKLQSKFVDACTDAISAYQPDIIHVHGTEDVYGLFTALPACTCPTVISIQGLIHVCSQHVMGGLKLGEFLSAGKTGLLAWLRYLLQEYQWANRGRSEQKIISGNNNFIGRTTWDKAHVLAVNPAAQYYYGGEVLRPEFYKSSWNIGNITRYTIFCTAAHSPLKGFHWLLQAVSLLRQEFPNIDVRIAGALWNENKGFGYYGRFIKKLIDKYELSSHVTSLPSLGAKEVSEELRTAHVFVIPSLIENSPNSLAEAMIVGTPSVASFVGGIPSIIDDGETALGFPSGDAAYLAYCIRCIFTDDALAQNLSEKAQTVAVKRHEPKDIVSRQLEIYRQILTAGKSNSISLATNDVLAGTIDSGDLLTVHEQVP